MAISIVDSHIHLFSKEDVKSLAWVEPGSALDSHSSVNEYRAATESDLVFVSSSQNGSSTVAKKCLRGFVFVETNRKSWLEEETGGWKHALDEVDLMQRIASGSGLPTESFSVKDSHLCLGFVPWAPLPLGPQRLEHYFDELQYHTKTETLFKKIRGLRYLAQDKPSGTLLTDDFIASAKLLGKRKVAFDVGVDARQGGLWQLKEAVEFIGRAHEGVSEDDKVTFIINHLCKPNLPISSDITDSTLSHSDFAEWRDSITAMAEHSKTYMKLSGLFSELGLSLTADIDINYPMILKRMKPWTDVVFDSFGPKRVMFGSDWPVCNAFGGGNAVTWQRWRKLVEMTLEERRLTEDEKADVWGGTAIKAYALQL